MMALAGDTLLVNDESAFAIGDTCMPFVNCNTFSFLGLKEDGSIKFNKREGGGDILLDDTTIYVFRSFSADTFEIADTAFIKIGPANSLNVIALEYDFNGNYIRSKHWSSSYKCRYNIQNSAKVGEDIFISGRYDRDTLQLDNQKISHLTWDDAFIGKINQSLECEWLTGAMGEDQETIAQFSVNADTESISIVGGFSADKLFLCGDTLFRQGSWGTSDMYFANLNFDGECNWIRQVKDFSTVWGGATGLLSDGSVIVAGSFEWNADFGDTVLTNVAISTNCFLAKYDPEGNLIKALQIEIDSAQFIRDMIITPNDEVWICGNFRGDELTLGDITASDLAPGHDAYVAKLDKNLNPLLISVFGGEGGEQCSMIRNGPGDRVYAVLETQSDTVQIGEEYFATHPWPQHHNYYVIEIQDTFITSVNSVPAEPIQVKLYPNPTQNDLQLDFEKPLSESLFFRLVTIDGRQVRNEQLSKGQSQFSLSLSGLPSGIYFYEIRNTARQFLRSGKILKRRD